MQRVAWMALVIALSACPGSHDGECRLDDDCGGNAICARNSECLPASEIRVVRITWTIRGAPATESACAQTPDLYLMFSGTSISDTFGYSPVPCKAGLFTVDKLPRRYVSVEIGVENRFAETAAIDANGNVAFDLVP
jgi:hypothetical protein